MTLKMTATLALTICAAGAAAAAGGQTVTKAASLSASATVQAIDATARTVTLRDEQNVEDTYSVSSDVQRLKELKVGDKVTFTYYESLVFQVRPAGEKPDAASVAAALNRAKGALPAGSLALQEKMTVTVKAIDPKVPSVTVATADGRTVTRKIEDARNIDTLKVGDLVDITYTRALVTKVERAK
jgi:Cu/Ag efflux protein CusF